MTHAVKHLEKLKRCITISLPKQDVRKAVQTRLNTLNKKIRMDGFRPGKVPMQILQKKYGPESEFKVVQDLASKHFFEAVKQDEIRLASAPSLDWPKEGETPSEQTSENYEVDILFEVLPNIEFGAFSDCAVTRRTTAITDHEVDRALEVARHKRGHYHERGSESEHGDGGGLEAQMGDRVTVALVNHWEAPAQKNDEAQAAEASAETEGDQKEQSQPKVHTQTFVLGLEAVSKELENAVVGLKKSETKTFDLILADNYFDPEWAGKAVQQTVTLTKVEWAHLPELNEEFLKSENFDSLESLREAQKKALETEAEKRTKALLRADVIEYLLNTTQFDVPEAVVREEQYAQFEQMFRRIFPDAQKLSSEDIRARHNLPADFMLDTASRRAKTGLILSELIRQNGLAAESAQLDTHFETFASEQNVPIEDVRRFFLGSAEHLNSLKAHIAEQNALDFILEKAQVGEESVSFKVLAEASSSLMN